MIDLNKVSHTNDNKPIFALSFSPINDTDQRPIKGWVVTCPELNQREYMSWTEDGVIDPVWGRNKNLNLKTKD